MGDIAMERKQYKFDPLIAELLEKLALKHGKFRGAKPSAPKLIGDIAHGIVPLMPLAATAILPEISAVYLCTDTEGKILYVGETGNLQKRWQESPEIIQVFEKMGVVVGICWVEIPQEQRKAAEQALISTLNPVLNGGSRLTPASVPSQAVRTVGYQKLLEYVQSEQPFKLVHRQRAYTVRYAKFQERWSQRTNSLAIYLDCWVEEADLGCDELHPEPLGLKHNRTLRLNVDDVDVSKGDGEWRKQGLDYIDITYQLFEKAGQVRRYQLTVNDINPLVQPDGSLIVTRRCTSWFWTWQRDLICRVPFIKILDPQECCDLIKTQIAQAITNY
jgi:hypothetical protein